MKRGVSTQNKNMNKPQIIILFLAIAAFSAFAYGYSIIDDPRMADGKLDYSEAYIWEAILVALALIIIVGSWLYAAKLTFSCSRWGWMIAVLILWPLSFVYLFNHFKKHTN